jgi:uncharacterized membrane protein
MRRYLLPALIGLVLGGLAHLVSVLALPRLALDDAYARLSQLGPPNNVNMVPDPTPFAAILPRMDPAFVNAVCVFDLSPGALQIRVPATPHYLSVSFYSRHGLAFYAISDRAAGRRDIDVLLMTPTQRAGLPEDEEITAADRLIIEAPSIEGIVMIRAFVPERGEREAVRTQLAQARCGTAT